VIILSRFSCQGNWTRQ